MTSIMCGHFINNKCKLTNNICRYKNKMNCKNYKAIKPPNLRDVDKCCGNCYWGGHYYDGESYCGKYGYSNLSWDSVCDSYYKAK